MASTDWSSLTNIIADGVAAQGATSGLDPMTGGGPNIWAFNSSTSSSSGAMASKYIGFAPLPVFDKGSIFTAAMVRYASVGSTGYSVGMFTCLGSDQTAVNANDSAYLLGLQDADPCHIVLAKGPVSAGIPDGDAGDLIGGTKILRKSVDVVSLGEWVHLKLSATVQANGDVHLEVWKSTELDLTNPPVWVAIDGMDLFTDDVTKVNSGTDPLTEGPPGRFWYQNQPNRAGAVDHHTVELQTTF